MDKTKKAFRKLKKLLNDDMDQHTNVGGVYYNNKAVEMVERSNKDFFMNSYYNLTTYNILSMTDESETLDGVKERLYEDYQSYYASAWYVNYVSVLNSLI